MHRRQALSLLGGGALALGMPAAIGCHQSTQIASAPWAGPKPTDEPRLQILSYAALAPNAHNTQPWRLDLRGGADMIDLYVDRERLLPETDPPYRQIHIGQGTFLEYLEVAANALGFDAAITYFPNGEYSPETIEDIPVASVRLEPSHATGDAANLALIRERRTNRRVYDGRPLTLGQIAAITDAAHGLAHVHVVADDAWRQRFAVVGGQAMRIEVSAEARNHETARWFRFSSAEADAKRDGFGLEQDGKPGFGRWFAETFVLGRDSADAIDGAFAKGAVENAEHHAQSASAFLLLSTESNTRLAQVLAGRAYARCCLAATKLGVAMHPMTQVTQEYADMAALKASFEHDSHAAGALGSTIQMFVRLGFATPTPHAPRRAVEDMLKT